MNRQLLLAILVAAVAPAALADDPAPTMKPDACLTFNNRILGPRAAGRPLPLQEGDPAHGFHPACTVPWSTLSPRNQPVPVTDCYRASLLQVANHAVCGRETGPLWISSRWVVTSAELADAHRHEVICQQLETGAWAGTRDFPLDCEPSKKELKPVPAPRSPAAPRPAAGPANLGSAPPATRAMAADAPAAPADGPAAAPHPEP